MVCCRPTTVSLCMIVRNEERNLVDCLRDVAELFDEVVIVDTGSTDKTREVAAQFATRVIDFPWRDDFAAARNEGLRHATGDWIFWLDADDRLSPGNIQRLRTLLDTLDQQPRVYLVDVISLPGDGGEPFVVTHQRLFPRNGRLQWQGRVHEQLHPEPPTIGIPWAWSEVQIEHVGYQDASLRERKLRRKVRLLNMDYAVDPNNISTLLHLGMAHLRVGTIGEAKRHLLRLEGMKLGPAPVMRWVYSALAECFYFEGNWNELHRILDRGLALFPDDESLLFTQAVGRYSQEQYAQAAALFRSLMAGTSRRHMQFGRTAYIRTKLAPRMLAAVHRMQRAFHESEATLTAMLQEFPDDAQGWYELGLAFLDSDQPVKFEYVIRSLEACPRGQVEGRILSALWALRHNQLPLAGRIIDSLVTERPRDSCPRMLRAEWLSRSGAPIEDQIRALRDLLRVHPGNSEGRRWLAMLEAAVVKPASPAATGWSSALVMPDVAAG